MFNLKYAYQLQLQWIRQDETAGSGFFSGSVAMINGGKLHWTL